MEYDPTCPPRDFTADHPCIAALWGYPPQPVPYRRPEQHSRPTRTPAQDPNALPSMLALAKYQREQAEKAGGADA